MNVILKNAREQSMKEILYADDLVLMSESIQNLKKKEAFERKELKVNLKKIKVRCF